MEALKLVPYHANYYQVLSAYKCSDCGYQGFPIEWDQSIVDEKDWPNMNITFVTLCPKCDSACYDAVENPIITP